MCQGVAQQDFVRSPDFACAGCEFFKRMPEMEAMKDYCTHRLLIAGPPHELKQFERKADWRGKFSNARFERHRLAEYSQVFKTVSVDAPYYQFPTVRWLEAMVSQVPDDFQFSPKVTHGRVHAEEISKPAALWPARGQAKRAFFERGSVRVRISPCGRAFPGQSWGVDV